MIFPRETPLKTNVLLVDYEKAKELFEQSLAIYKKYSETHVGAAWVAGDLGDTYIKLGNHKKAKGILAEIYLKKSKNAPINKDAHQSEHLQRQAISYFKQALDGVKSHFSENSPHITRIQTNLDTCTNLEQN